MLGRQEAFVQGRAHGAGSNPGGRRPFGGYRFLNTVIGIIGVIVLAWIFQEDLASHMKLTLLTVGLFFFLQLAPLALPNMQRLRTFLNETGMTKTEQRSTAGERDAYSSARLFQLSSPLPVFIAFLIYAAYIVFTASQWNGEINTQVAKILVLTGSNIFLIALVGRGLSRLRRSGGPDAEKQYKNLRLAVPMFAFISMMLSIYFFGKEIIFDIDVHQLRPVMMSIFLQVLGILSLGALYSRKS